MLSPSSVLCLLAAVLLAVPLASAGGGSNEYHSQCQRAPELVTPSQPEEPESCPLVVGLVNCGSSLSASENATLSVLVNSIVGVVNNTNMTIDQQVSWCALQISVFFSLNVQIAESMEFCSFNGVGGVPFGFIRDVIEIGVQIDSLSVDAQVTLDVNGNCPLFTALTSACASLGDSATTSAVNSLIASITLILQGGGFTIDQQLALISIQFSAFFTANPSMQSFVLSVQLGAFGSVGNLVGVCGQFEQIATLSSQLSGTSPADCPLLTALNGVAQNSSYNLTVRVQIQQLITVIEANFTATLDSMARLSCVSNQIFSLLQLEPWLAEIIFSIQISVQFGDVYDLLSCSHFCSENSACPLVDQGLTPVSSTTTGPLTTTGTTNTASTSGSNSTSAPPTSIAPPTTSLAPPNCSQVSLNSLVAAQPSGKCILLESIIVAVGNWSQTVQLEFKSTLNKLKKDLKIKKKEAKMKPKKLAKKQKQKCKKAVKHLSKFSKHDASTRKLMLDIPIVSSNGTYWGTLGAFCVCVKPNFKLA